MVKLTDFEVEIHDLFDVGFSRLEIFEALKNTKPTANKKVFE